MTKEYSYDERCEDLARYFLADCVHTEEHVKQLSQEIQDTIETWLTYDEASPERIQGPEGTTGERRGPFVVPSKGEKE